ncbi:MAG: monovalent cation/H+ antiporter subunit D family protein [Firmicutes bacterium]|nr:monovalent cation/H+ antiporter subunit D family protein [Bacillota bacterium]MBV1727691.1 monovalent cation/H+ antiporter subunit D family protein [Desulforudis sp.]MBU4532753.1 monovalent cation/H+ antiporter subunit D family protein [Bacillota bacterium]MBU4554586.1 monovalent cation/H+ antiporter subunit D family protein [Bacillota bacterium]MBV1736254.1 monovalent cation/H+ antiporter subunit D family protein [Desulforudis sp.]
MEIIQSAAPLYAVLVSLLAVVLIGVSGRNPNLRESWTIIAALIKFSIVVSMLPKILDGTIIEYTAFSVMPGLDIAFRVDPLAMFFALTASLLWIVTAFYCIGYMRAGKEKNQTRFYMCFAVALSAAMGIAFSANLFTLFVFYEVLSLCTYPLVVHKQTPEAIKGARTYLFYLLGSSIAFQLAAIILTYHYAGTLEFVAGGILAGTASNGVITLIFILFIAGIAKAGIMPLHIWLPAAMVAPTPVSALLHAVAVVKAGVFTVVKVVLFVFGVDLLKEIGLGMALAYVASFTIIVASIMAMRQDNLKARLAYSTVSQLSYIVVAVALLSASGITASLIHIMIHAYGKITLFFVAGAIYIAAHKTKVSELDGIGRQMPFTMIAFTIGAFSMIGVPPFAGFISKWYMALGAIEANMYPIIGVIILSSILNACYFMPIVYAAFFKPVPLGESAKMHEAPAHMVVPLCFTAFGVLVLFFASPFLLNLARMVVTSVTGGS